MSTDTTISIAHDSSSPDPSGTSGEVTVRISIHGRHTTTRYLAPCAVRTSFHVQPWSTAAGGHVADLLRRYEFSDADAALVQRKICDFSRECLAGRQAQGAQTSISVENTPFSNAGWMPTAAVGELLRDWA